MKTPLTQKQRTARHAAKKKAAGFVRVFVWVLPEWKQRLRKFVEMLGKNDE